MSVGQKQLTQSDKAKYRPEHNKKPDHWAERAIYTQLLLRRLVFKGGFKGRGDALYFVHFWLATYTDCVLKQTEKNENLAYLHVHLVYVFLHFC